MVSTLDRIAEEENVNLDDIRKSLRSQGTASSASTKLCGRFQEVRLPAMGRSLRWQATDGGRVLSDTHSMLIRMRMESHATAS